MTCADDFLGLINVEESDSQRDVAANESEINPRIRELEKFDPPREPNGPKVWRKAPRRIGPQRRNVPPAPLPNVIPGPPNAAPPIRDPFRGMPPQLPVPVPDEIGKPVSLIEVPLEQLDNFELVLVDVDQLSLTRLPQDTAPRTWAVSDGGSTIATFSIVNNSLQFTWSAAPNRVAISALRNAILKIHANQFDHFVTLRAPTVVEPLATDLNNATDRVVCTCDDLPDTNKLRVDILGFDSCPRYSCQGPAQGLKLGDATTLLYTDAPGATTKVTFATFSNLPAIELETRYVLPSGAQGTMKIGRGNETLRELRRVARVQRNDAAKKDLVALERIAKLANQLHEKMKMRFRFYCIVDEHEIELATTQ